MTRIVLIFVSNQLRLVIVGLVFAILFFNCNGSNPVNIQKAPKITHNTRISEDETWTSSQTHLITEHLIVENATLTIEPGTKIEFQDDASLIITTNGALHAIGNESDSIRFIHSGLPPNSWGKIYFNKNCRIEICQLEYCVLENGGSGDSLSAMMICCQVVPSIRHSSIRNSVTNGIRIIGPVEMTNFGENEIINNRLAPIILSTSAIAALKPNCLISGNGLNVIRVVKTDSFTQDVTWPAMNVPYQFETDLQVYEHQIHLQPGVKMQFLPPNGIQITQKGTFIAIGKPDSNIIFRGVQHGRGVWKGIQINDIQQNSQLDFAYCKFDGGGNYPLITSDGTIVSTLVYCKYAHPDFSNCTFQNSSGYGVIFDKDSEPTRFENNTLLLNAGPPIRITPALIGRIKNNRFLTNGENYIEVTHGNITSGTYVHNILIPYRLTGAIDIFYALLRIEPGTKIELTNMGSISVSAGGALIADGNSVDTPIIFTGTFQTPGAWKYIYFGADCNDGRCKLNYCHIEYGGGDIGWPANIYLEGVSPAITNCTIGFSKHWGIFKSNNANPDLSNSVFIGNSDGDIWP